MLETLGPYDVVVIGGGLAGLCVAYEASRQGARVVILSKTHPLRSNSVQAQAGIAAWIPGHSDRRDHWLVHMKDTVVHSDYLADQDVVETLVSEAPNAIKFLEKTGVVFARQGSRFAARRLGGHTFPRVRYVGLRTGRVIVNRVYATLMQGHNVDVFEFPVLELVVEDGFVKAVVALDIRESTLVLVYGKVFVIATGGCGALYSYTTNNLMNTCDGYAMALRAGFSLKDMEFVQFHPTAVYPTGILVSEAARSEGGVLLNALGERFMKRYVPQLLELAPRDVVARAIEMEIREGRGFEDSYVLLDLTHISDDVWRSRLSDLRELLVKHVGLDPAHQPVPVRPAYHYMMGGIDVTPNGLVVGANNLFAAGEAACLSVHGANRLGGNSLLEAVVYGRIVGRKAAQLAYKLRWRKPWSTIVKGVVTRIESLVRSGGVDANYVKSVVRRLMWERVGIIRHERMLIDALRKLKTLLTSVYERGLHVNGTGVHELLYAYEALNMLEIGYVIALSALYRRESRGAHYRLDYPYRDDARYLKHTIVSRFSGSFSISWKPVRVVRWLPGERLL